MKYLLRHLAGNLVLAVAIRDAADEDRCDDQGPLQANSANHVIEHAFLAPTRISLVDGFREAEVRDASPHLLCAVELVGSQQLLRA